MQSFTYNFPQAFERAILDSKLIQNYFRKKVLLYEIQIFQMT